MLTRIIAHRGASKAAPENTLAAFRKAIDLGVHGIELDVQLSRDGHLVVCHDEKVDRTTDGTGYVKDIPLAEIKRLDAGSWFSCEFRGERTPTLEEVMELLKGRDILLNVELKTGLVQYENIEDKTLKVLEQYNYLSNTIISSFNHYSLAKIHKLAPHVQLGILYVAGLYEPWNYARSLGATALHPYYPSVTPEVLKSAREHGIHINTFTVDDPIIMKQLIKAGVDGLITNYPGKALAILQEMNDS